MPTLQPGIFLTYVVDPALFLAQAGQFNLKIT